MPRRLLLTCALLAGPAFGADLTGGMVPTDHISLPDGPAAGVVALVSDTPGWGSAEDAAASALQAKGIAVIGIDLPTYRKALDAAPTDCVYLIADIEELSHEIQRSLGGPDYHAPLLAGTGDAGGLVLSLLVQTPAATIGGTIVTDPSADIDLAKQLCTTAKHHEDNNGAIYDLPIGPLPNPVSIGLTAEAPQDVRDRVEAFHADAVGAEIVEGVDPGPAGLVPRIEAMVAASQVPGLPVIELPATPSHGTLAIVLSGDGGWRDLDSTIGSYLQADGVPTVGLDTLRYFWSRRTPEETAHDLSALIRHYTEDWGTPNVALVGYSFGADVLPAVYLALDPEARARVSQISLLGLAPKADWEITVSGWLGSSSTAATDTGPALAQLPPGLVQCLYGEAETDSPCPNLPGVEVMRTKGGHHYDGNYKALAERILAGIDSRRPAETSNAPATAPALPPAAPAPAAKSGG